MKAQQQRKGQSSEHLDGPRPPEHGRTHPPVENADPLPSAKHDAPGQALNPPQKTRTLELRRPILEKNDRLAERNRELFRARKILVLNVLSSPGSGKTTFLTETLRRLTPRLKAGVVVGDLATDNDARRLRESGAQAVQITTGTMCHLEARMVARAVSQLDLDGLELLFIENVGNLVCPASYDLGEELRVVLLSVTEGEDKPLKYPPMFQTANIVVVSKMDLAEACGFSREALLANLRRVAPAAKVFEVSARNGQGMQAWEDFLLQEKRTPQQHQVAGP